MIALAKGLAFYDPGGRELQMLLGVEQDQPRNRFNDGKVDRHGRYWAGTMNDIDWDEPGAKDALDVRIAVAVDLAVRGDVVVATLHAPQLRGDAYNTGWFASGLVAALRMNETRSAQATSGIGIV